MQPIELSLSSAAKKIASPA